MTNPHLLGVTDFRRISNPAGTRAEEGKAEAEGRAICCGFSKSVYRSELAQEELMVSTAAVSAAFVVVTRTVVEEEEKEGAAPSAEAEAGGEGMQAKPVERRGAFVEGITVD